MRSAAMAIPIGSFPFASIQSSYARSRHPPAVGIRTSAKQRVAGRGVPGKRSALMVGRRIEGKKTVLIGTLSYLERLQEHTTGKPADVAQSDGFCAEAGKVSFCPCKHDLLLL